MEWQKIETAPRDGSVLILRNGDSVVAGWWAPQGEGKYGVDWFFVDDTTFAASGCCDREVSDRISPNGWCRGLSSPTHWMPLPEALKENQNV